MIDNHNRGSSQLTKTDVQNDLGSTAGAASLPTGPAAAISATPGALRAIASAVEVRAISPETAAQHLRSAAYVIDGLVATLNGIGRGGGFPYFSADEKLDHIRKFARAAAAKALAEPFPKASS